MMEILRFHHDFNRSKFNLKHFLETYWVTLLVLLVVFHPLLKIFYQFSFSSTGRISIILINPSERWQNSFFKFQREFYELRRI